MISSGTIRYSPKLLGNNPSKWWIIISCDSQLIKYYRHLYKICNHNTQEIMRPAWDAHITVVRNEEPPNKEFWNKYESKIVEFKYIPQFDSNGFYWWMPIVCQELLDLRTELGLGDPDVPLHISIGHFAQ